ncbi:MAG: PilZ domain-containing protein [Nitrospiraceae bacterium]|nr:MAG: PilZ domain-containing protein [Nitrospiraceae bacterium]
MSKFYSRKRAYERIPVHIRTSFFYNNQSYAGTLKDLSLIGMYIEADQSLPVKSKADLLNPFKSYCVVHVPLRAGTLKVIVKIRRLVKVDNNLKSMGVELVNPSQDYLEFVSSIRNYCLINIPQPSPKQMKNRII